MADSEFEYSAYDPATQPKRKIERYPLSFTRTPAAPLIERPLTLTERTGPSGRGSGLPTELDLAGVTSGRRATGQLLGISGRVTDEDGSPVVGVVIELWQANAAGKYVHEMDRHEAPVDPNFTGEGRMVTDAEGQYKFFSIKPGAYPVLESGWWWRPPHIHFSILGPSWMSRFVTQIYFPGEPLNETDLLLNGVPDREVRERLIFQFDSTTMSPLSAMNYRKDFVLRGHRRTPALD